jgi:hypothetical protein
MEDTELLHHYVERRAKAALMAWVAQTVFIALLQPMFFNQPNSPNHV